MRKDALVILLFFACANPSFGQPITIAKLVLLPQSITDDRFTTILLRQNSATLDYKRNSFLIYFCPKEPVDQFAFRLNGIMLHELTTRNNFAFFNNLPAGEYQFTVRAVGKPKWPPAQLSLVVEAPVWLRWWFLPLLFLYGIALMAIGFYLLYQYRLRQLLHLQAVRENIARDLHDDMGSYLSSISILSQGVVNLFQSDPQRARTMVQKIGETARQVMDSMGEIIWSVNPANDSMAQIVTHMRDLGGDLLQEQNVTFTLEAEEQVLQNHLSLEKRRDFFLIYKEALNNIAKYAKAEHVWVKFHRNGTSLRLTIQDDGVGFDPLKLTPHHFVGGNGLKNMRERAEKLGGILTINSVAGKGTTIQLQI